MGALLVLILLAGGALAAEDPPDSALDDRAYRFCHVDGASADEARDWCALLEDLPEDRCPGLRATCDGATADEWSAEEAWDQMTAGCSEGQDGRRGELAPPPDKPEDEPMSCSQEEPESCEASDLGCDLTTPMGALGTLARWIAAFAVAGVLLIILRLIFKYMGRRERSLEVEGEGVVRDHQPLHEARDVPDMPSADLLAAAREALARGRPGEALLMARAAVLRGLGEDGRLRLHRSRTDREYVRQVRGSELARPLAEVVGAVEDHKWGGRQATEGRAAAVIALVEQMLARTALLLLATALATGIARAEDRFGPWGDAGIQEVLEDHGLDAAWRLRGFDSLDAEVDVLVVDAQAVAPSTEDWNHLRAWVEAGGLLVVGGLPPQEQLPELGTTWLWVFDDASVREEGELLLDTDLVALGLPAPSWPGGAQKGWEGGEGRAWVTAPGGEVLVQSLSVGAGHVLAIGDDRLLCNGALVDPANEVFLGRMLYLGHDLGLWSLPWEARVQLATRAVESSDSPLSALANANLLPLVVQLLALLALVALWLGWPFAPLEDPPGEGRLAFADHVRAMAARYNRLRASRHALGAYAALWLQRLGPQGLERAALRAGYTPQEAGELIARLQQAAEAPDGPRHKDDLELVEELWRITRP